MEERDEAVEGKGHERARASERLPSISQRIDPITLRDEVIEAFRDVIMNTDGKLLEVAARQQVAATSLLGVLLDCNKFVFKDILAGNPKLVEETSLVANGDLFSLINKQSELVDGFIRLIPEAALAVYNGLIQSRWHSDLIVGELYAVLDRNLKVGYLSSGFLALRENNPDGPDGYEKEIIRRFYGEPLGRKGMRYRRVFSLESNVLESLREGEKISELEGVEGFIYGGRGWSLRRGRVPVVASITPYDVDVPNFDFLTSSQKEGLKGLRNPVCYLVEFSEKRSEDEPKDEVSFSSDVLSVRS